MLIGEREMLMAAAAGAAARCASAPVRGGSDPLDMMDSGEQNDGGSELLQDEPPYWDGFGWISRAFAGDIDR
jgi:hypothetical protein